MPPQQIPEVGCTEMRQFAKWLGGSEVWKELIEAQAGRWARIGASSDLEEQLSGRVGGQLRDRRDAVAEFAQGAD